MKRIVLVVLRSLLQLPYWWGYQVRKFSNRNKYTIQDGYDFIHKVVPTVTRRCRVKLEIFGLENLPKEGGYLLAPNHQGLFDPLAIFQSHKRAFRAIVKKELSKVILIKDIMKMLGFIPMDRSDVRESAKIIKYVSSQIKEGQVFLVFPEGTRCRNKNKILDFKGGTFKVATKANAPIVPVALINCYKVFDNNNIKKTTAQIHYLEPLYYEDYKDLKTNEIAKIVHDRVEECILANEKHVK